MTKHDHWKTTDVDGEDAAYREERITEAFCREYGTIGNVECHEHLLEAFGRLLNATDLYDLLVAEFDKLTADQQESFLGMDND